MTATTEFVPGPKLRGSKPAASTQVPLDDESAPKRNGTGRERTPTPAKTPRSTKSLETQIGATLTVINLMLMSVPRIREDALDVTEIQALAKSLDLQCKTSPRFRKYVEGMLSAGSGAGLLGVCLLIGARRAARHDMIPRDFDGAFASLLAGTANRQPVEA
jgi:hypothetical protein